MFNMPRQQCFRLAVVFAPVLLLAFVIVFPKLIYANEEDDFLALMKRKEYPSAIRVATKLINELESSSKKDFANLMLYYHLRGLAYDEIKDYNKAISDYTKALEFKENNRDLWTETIFVRARSYYFADKMKEAISDFSEWLKIGTPSKELEMQAYMYRGECYLSLRMAEESVKDFSYYINGNPTNEGGWLTQS